MNTWLIDPGKAEINGPDGPANVPWNGEYYVSFGEGERRRWADAREYGYISAGGGAWYSNTLHQLEPGARIWVNVPGKGYVGVGKVTGTAQPLTEFRLRDETGRMRPIYEVVPSTPPPDQPSDLKEYYVPVEWIKTLPLAEAIKEKGFFGNQNSVAKPKAKKWVHTVERLKARFGVDEQDLGRAEAPK